MQTPQTLTVAPAAPLAASGFAKAPGNLKWMWAAIGGLGACVVALATVLVVQHTGGPSTETAAAPAALLTSPSGPSAAPGTLGAPVAALQPQGAQAFQGYQGAAAAPAPVSAPVATQRPVAGMPASQQGGAPTAGAWPESGPSGQPGATGTPVAQRAAICKTCGQVESVQAIEQAAPPTGVGAVAGGVLGAVVGNQIGKGNGRTAATVLGAVGGGYAGHQIEKRTRTQTTYQVRVRMEDGSSRVFTRSQPPAVGTPVVLQGKGFRVADERAMPQAQQPQPQYQTVSQPGYVAMQQ